MHQVSPEKKCELSGKDFCLAIFADKGYMQNNI
jgi:hypothetical protein